MPSVSPFALVERATSQRGKRGRGWKNGQVDEAYMRRMHPDWDVLDADQHADYKVVAKQDPKFESAFPLPPLVQATSMLQAHSAGVDAVTWLRDDLVSASHDGSLKVLGLSQDENGAVQLKVKKTLSKRHRGGVYTCAASADASCLVSGGAGPSLGNDDYNMGPGDMLVWKCGKDLGNVVVALAGHSSAIYSACFGPGSQGSSRVMSSNRGGTVLVHDINRPTAPLLMKQVHTGVAHSTCFCPSAPDLYVTAGADGHVRTGDLRVPQDAFQAFWSMPSTLANYQYVRPAAGIEAAHDGEKVYTATYASEYMIVSGGADFKLKGWDMRMQAGADAGTCVKEFLGHSAPVRHVAIDEQQARAVSACADGSLRVWPLAAAANSEQQRGIDLNALDDEIRLIRQQIESTPRSEAVQSTRASTEADDLLERHARLVSARERRVRTDHQEASCLLDGHSSLAACAAWKGDWVATAAWDQTVRLFAAR